MIDKKEMVKPRMQSLSYHPVADCLELASTAGSRKSLASDLALFDAFGCQLAGGRTVEK